MAIVRTVTHVLVGGCKTVCNELVDANWLVESGHSMAYWFERAKLIKSGDKIKAALLTEKRVFIKSYKACSLIQKIRAMMGFGRAKKVFEISMQLQSLGVPVATPVAYVGQASFCDNVSYFLCEALVESCVDLKELRFSDGWKQIDQQALLGDIARGIANMHEGGFCHGDMKWSNIIVDPDTGQFWLVDLDGARAQHIKNRDAGRDLARFLVNANEFELDEGLIKTFIDAYAKARSCDSDEVRQWVMPAYEKLAARHRLKYASKI